MLTESGVGAIPSDTNGGIASGEQVDMFRRAPESIRFESFGFEVWTFD